MLDVIAEVPVAAYAVGGGPDPARVAGADLGNIPIVIPIVMRRRVTAAVVAEGRRPPALPGVGVKTL